MTRLTRPVSARGQDCAGSATPSWAPHIEPLPFAREFADLRQRAGSREEFARQLPDAWIDQLALVGDPQTAAARVATLKKRRYRPGPDPGGRRSPHTPG